MSEPSHKTDAHSHSKAGSAMGRAILRLYALCILLIVVWTGYTAVAYLARYVFVSARVPDQYRDPLAQGLPAIRPAEAGATTQPVAEPAISHYHRDPQGFAFIGVAGCTTSGCHTLLPHTRRKEVRAFANFHSTFLDCSACHDADVHSPTAAVWLENQNGTRQSPPALLRLMTTLETRADEIQSKPAELNPELLALLREAEKQVGVDPPLHNALVELDTSEPGSPVWRQAVVQLQQLLPNRVRGEYGARITPAKVADEWSSRQQRLSLLTKEFFASPVKEREHVVKQVHDKVLAKPDACMTCHGEEPARLELDKLGYSPQRIATLKATPIAHMIQQIRQGQPFHLPQLLEPRNGK